METSDSECFESADEEIISDDEELTTKMVKKLGTIKLSDEPNDLLLKMPHSVAETTQKIDKNTKQNDNANINLESKEKYVKEIQDTNANEVVTAVKQLNTETNKVSKVSSVQNVHDNFEPKGLNQIPKTDYVTEKTKLDVNDIDTENMWGNEEWEDGSPNEFDNKNEENMWNDDEDWSEDLVENKNKEHENAWSDEWESVDSNTTASENQIKASETWGTWGNWGISSVLSTATSLTSQVSQGLSSVLESSIGVPNPEDLARMHKEKNEQLKEASESSKNDIIEVNKSIGFGLGNLVSGVTQITKLVEETSTKVISGGLDTLETIGKKTMEVLQENDPGLKSKTAFLKMDQNKPILSQLLREAKEKAENENKIREQKHFTKKANYETLFDDHQGLVHLEALEMLSKQCDIKLETLLQSYVGNELKEMQETMEQVKELCELPEEEDEDILTSDLEDKLSNAIADINVNITYDKLIKTWKEVEEWLATINLTICNENEIHQQAIETLAQLTAIAVEQFHKAGELLLIKEHRSTADEADSLVQLTLVLTNLMGVVSSKFSEKLNLISSTKQNKEDVNSLITNVFYEAANSSSYIKDAFKLLIPVLLVGAV